MRNNKWLEDQLALIWSKYFGDVPKLNNIHISFGRKAKRRLASIRQLSRKNKKSDTKITITGYYRDEQVPERVVAATIAHELCHYAHGFASPLPQFSRYPHRGDVVDNELRNRGLGEDLQFQEKWLKENWNQLVKDKIYSKKKSKKPPFSLGSFFLSKLNIKAN